MRYGLEVRPGINGDPIADPAVIRDLAHRYLIWDAFVSGGRRVEVRPLVLSGSMHRSAVQAAEGVVRALGNVADRAFADDGERSEYGFHPDVVRLATASKLAGDTAGLFRVDLLLGNDGEWRACEVNADCPGGLNEAFGLPRLARQAGFRQGTNPTHVLESLVARLASLAQRRDDERPAIGLTFATAYAEDLQICAFVRQSLRRAGCEAVLIPPTAPHWRDGSLRVGKQTLGVAYRYFPTEYMEGMRNLDDWVEAVERGSVRTLSSFAWMFVQSKVVMARAWAHRSHLEPAFAKEIERHVPQTFDVREVPDARLRSERPEWVLKRALGRVGDEVFVGSLMNDDEWRDLSAHVRAQRTAGERWLAQRFVPQQSIPTPWGDRFVTLGAYVLDGRFAGYFARVTPVSHVSHDAMVVPVFVEEDSE